MVLLLARDLGFKVIFVQCPMCIWNIEYKLAEIFASSYNKNSKGIRVMAMGDITNIIRASGWNNDASHRFTLIR